MKSVRTTVSLSQEQYQSLQHLAESCGLSMSWVIRQAVSEFLTKHDARAFNPVNLSQLRDEQK
ncbi:ribbon-helix-helix domain-containing protein [Oceanisphaera pacifica]|uniref:CopG family transcriptional regulator n=1 Tax=Oceanisphaera pacifica TaxID=2818389 RepID=A0ABS3NCK2_9GAMM|nr:CopG family transcriptional regulator [Oceanisphaera pacifica]